MKTLKQALFAFLLIVPFVLVDTGPAAAADVIAADGTTHQIGEGTIRFEQGVGAFVEMPDGSTRPLSDSEMLDGLITSLLTLDEENKKDDAALSSTQARQLTDDMRNVVLANAGGDPIVAAIITSYIVAQAPIFAGPLTTGALLGAGAGAAPLILNTVANIPNVNFIQVVADVNNNPEIPQETKQVSNTVLATTTQPAAGGDQGGDTGDDLVTDGEETAENPAQTTETNPTP